MKSRSASHWIVSMVVMVVLLSLSVSAGDVVVMEQTGTNYNDQELSGVTDAGGSTMFIANRTVYTNRTGMYMYAIGSPTGTMHACLWSQTPVNGSVLGCSQTTPQSQLDASSRWVEFNFTTHVQLVDGSLYSLQLGGTVGSPTHSPVWRGNNAVPAFNTHVNNTGTWQVALTGRQKTFRIYNGTPTYTATIDYPPSGWVNNTAINITASSTFGTVDIYMDTSNPPTTKWLAGAASPATVTTNQSTDATYFIMACKAGDCLVNSTVINWTLDTADPALTGFTSASHTVNTTFVRVLSAFDTHLYSMNVTCTDDMFTYTNTSIMPSTTANVTINITLNQTMVCAYEVCDGHTARSIDGLVDVVQNASDEVSFRWRQRFAHTLRVAPSSAAATLNTTRETDRVTFTVTPVDKSVTQTVVLYYTVSPRAEYVNSRAFPAWIIDPESKTWFDAVGATNVRVFRINPTTFEVRFNTRGAVTLRSTGALNCVSGSFTTTAAASTASDTLEEVVAPLACQNDSVADVLMYVFLFCILVTMLIVVKKHMDYPIMTLLIYVGFVFYGMSLMGCWQYIGVVMVGLSLIMACIEALDAFNG